jgi:hypothetical protein
VTCACPKLARHLEPSPRPQGTPGKKPRRLDDRLWEWVDRGEEWECWPWVGRTTKAGYGQISLGKYDGQRTLYVHRVAYELLVGTIPEGLVIDHLCCNRTCCNPAHLEPVTHAENVRRGSSRRFANQTHCKHGHEFAGDNLYLTPWGERVCRECARRRNREYDARKKAAA